MTPEGDFSYVSPSCERISGYTPEEFISDPDLMNRITHPDDRAKMLDHYHKERKVISHAVDTMDFRIIRRDGAIRWIGHVCQPVYGQEGQPFGRRGSNRDITDRKRLDEEKVVVDLEKALSEVKKLSGFPPICASCRKIRDDRGYWRQVEEYKRSLGSPIQPRYLSGLYEKTVPIYR